MSHCFCAKKSLVQSVGRRIEKSLMNGISSSTSCASHNGKNGNYFLWAMANHSTRNPVKSSHLQNPVGCCHFRSQGRPVWRLGDPGEIQPNPTKGPASKRSAGRVHLGKREAIGTQEIPFKGGHEDKKSKPNHVNPRKEHKNPVKAGKSW